ncbi:MAG: hypothetical protein KatS3mg094_277 [Candidatus Parcubacteria bacterium]|nr:MAG: hypothetical protein KatS3mg094_277 [Candidatus Parcubacteria bacterium]
MTLIYLLFTDLIQLIYKFIKFYFFEANIILSYLFKNNNLKFAYFLNYKLGFKNIKFLSIFLQFLFISINFIIYLSLIIFWLSLPFIISFLLIL